MLAGVVVALRVAWMYVLPFVTNALRRGDARRYVAVRRAVIGAQRRKLAELRASHAFPGDVLRGLEHELDLDEARLPRSARRR